MNLPLEFLAFSPIKSYLVWGILTVLNKIIKFERFQYQEVRKWEEKYTRRLLSGKETKMLKALKTEMQSEVRSHCFPTSGFCLKFNNRMHDRNHMTLIHRLAQHSAEFVNKFFSSIRSAKRISCWSYILRKLRYITRDLKV